jgi:RNA polymerase sigma-70 factor (ECF subfamily)
MDPSRPEEPEPPDPPAAETPQDGRPSGDDSDHPLIRAAQQGDERAFEALVRRHEQRAMRIARNLVGSEEDARDLAQEAFLRVFRSLERFDFQHAFATWLHRIVTNLAIDHLRRRRLAYSTTTEDGGPDVELPDPDAPAPSRRLEAVETARRVRETIASLAPHFQAVLVLRELENLPCTEIARIVGATHVTVRWRLHRGRKLFQEEWERRERLEAGANSGAARPVQPVRKAGEAE